MAVKYIIDNLSGQTIFGSLSATSFSADTFYGDGSNLIGIGSPFTGGSVSGETFFTSGLSATTFSATTIGESGNCVTDLYVSNIHSCSPLNINPLNEGNVFVGSANTLTVDVSNNRVGIGVLSPSEKLEVSGKTKTLELQITSGANTNYILTSDNLGNASWSAPSGITGLPCEIQVAASDETTAITSGTSKVTFRTPYAMTVTEVRASLTTAQTSGNTFTVDINSGGTSILSTKITIDNTKRTSVTAVTPPVISTTTLSDDSEMTVDVDQIGSGTATGLKVTIKGYRT